MFEQLLRHILSTNLSLNPSQWPNTKVLLIIPATWGLDTRGQLLEVLLGHLGLQGAFLGEETLLAAYGCGLVNAAVVVNLGHRVTSVGVVMEGDLVVADRIPVGGDHLDLAILQKTDSSTLDLSAVRQARESGLFSHDESHQQQSLTISADTRNLILQQILLDPLAQAIANAIDRIDEMEKRPILWDSIILTGLTTRPMRKTLVDGLQATLRTRHLAISEYAGDHQSMDCRIRGIPEYYPDVWEAANPVAAWFGGGVMAKMVFPDSKAHYTREDYLSVGGKKILFTKKL